jgi:hypothetical protein
VTTSDDENVAEAEEFERGFRAVLEGFDRIRQLRGRFLDGMIELEAFIDELLCDFLRVELDRGRRDLARCTVLAMNFGPKIKTLEVWLVDAGMSIDVIAKLDSLAKLRNVLAHAQATRPAGSMMEKGDPLTFLSYQHGRVKRTKVTELELEQRVEFDLS